MSRRQYAGEFDEEMAQARRRADEGQRRYDEENERDYAKWRNAHASEFAEESFFDTKGTWDFRPLTEESGRVSGFKVMLNGRFVAMIIPRGNDLVVLMSDPEGVKVSYRGGHIDAQNVISAFMAQKQLKEGV